jgi:hypothetical protein
MASCNISQIYVTHLVLGKRMRAVEQGKLKIIRHLDSEPGILRERQVY